MIIRLGDDVYHGREEDEGFSLLRFLNAIMYPHQHNFMETISEYIDYSDNEELWKGAERMEGLGESILAEGFEQGIEQGICLMVETLQELGQTKRHITDMLVQKYMLSEEEAEIKTEQYWR